MTSSFPSRREAMRVHRDQGGRVAAVLPIHYPRELLAAFGFLPVEMWGPPRQETGAGDAHLQAYTCSIVRSALSFLKGGGAEEVDAIFVPHACDSLQGLASLLLDFEDPGVPVFPFYIPRADRPVDRDFLADEFRQLAARLAELTGTQPDEAGYREVAALQEEADSLLGELARSRECLPVSDQDYYRLVRAREYLPAESFIVHAGHLLDRAAATADEARSGRGGGVPLLLSGIVPEPMAIFEVIAEVGGRVVADDYAACGRRLYPPGRASDPFQRMAERILAAPPDPTRGTPIADRVDDLVAQARRTEAKGVVIHTVKFCEPELFDVPLLVEGLRKADLPSLLVEVDISDAISGQTRTRLEAFLEMLS